MSVAIVTRGYIAPVTEQEDESAIEVEGEVEIDTEIEGEVEVA